MMKNFSPARVGWALTCALLAGCASQPEQKRDPRDPLERLNRATYAFNDTLDRAIAKPAARAYRKVAPQFVETGVSNFFDNLGYPVVIVNDVLQGKMTLALRDTGRLLLNSTFGLGGLLDPASTVGLEENDEDFGQTLGVWGVRTGPYLMLPILGPSTVRDGFGRGVDQFAQPQNYVDDDAARWALRAANLLDTRARLLDAERALGEVYDRYAFIRNAYLQRREYLVTDGKASLEDESAEIDLEESATMEQDNETAPPAGPANQTSSMNDARAETANE